MTAKDVFACALCGKVQNRKKDGSVTLLPGGDYYTVKEIWDRGIELCGLKCSNEWRATR